MRYMFIYFSIFFFFFACGWMCITLFLHRSRQWMLVCTCICGTAIWYDRCWATIQTQFHIPFRKCLISGFLEWNVLSVLLCLEKKKTLHRNKCIHFFFLSARWIDFIVWIFMTRGRFCNISKWTSKKNEKHTNCIRICFG